MDSLNKNPTSITDLFELYDLINDLQNYSKNLFEENKKLIEQKQELVEKNNKYLDMMALDILNYFNKSKSIKETAEKYDMTIEELMDWIPYWDGCYDGLQSAKDYKDYVKQKEYRSDEEEESYEEESDEDYYHCTFCNKNSIEFRCIDCESKICYPCRARCINCMETICPNCNNKQQICSKCFE
jgi:hypothetical protein